MAAKLQQQAVAEDTARSLNDSEYQTEGLERAVSSSKEEIRRLKIKILKLEEQHVSDSQAIVSLETELGQRDLVIQEWADKCAATRRELEAVVEAFDSANYEAKIVQLNAQIRIANQRVQILTERLHWKEDSPR